MSEFRGRHEGLVEEIGHLRTQVRQLEQTLHQFECIVSNAHDMIAMLNRDFVYLIANDAYLEALGMAPDEVVGHSVSEILGKEVFETVIKPSAIRCLRGHEVCYRDWFEFPAKGRLYMDVVCSPYCDHDGKVNGFIVSARDISEQKRAETQLADSEKRSRAWLEYSPICTKIVDLDLNLQYMSTAGVKGLGIDDISEFYGTPYPFEFYPDAFRRRMTENLNRVKDTGAIITQEAPVVDLQGNELWFHSTLVPVHDHEGHIEYIIVVSVDTTARRQAEQLILDHEAQLKSLVSELVLAEERERNRIAIHLHDDVAQALAYSKMKLQMLNAALDDQSQTQNVTEVCDTLTRMMQEIHSLTFELSSPVLTELGLEAAVSHWLTEEVERKHGIVATFTCDDQAKPLSEDMQSLLFRSVRELLANVVKHSQAKQVRVRISRDQDQILIHLEDDGIGFELDKVVTGAKTRRFGLFSIRERLSQMGGSMVMDSSPGQGCRSLLRAPVLTSDTEQKPGEPQ